MKPQLVGAFDREAMEGPGQGRGCRALEVGGHEEEQLHYYSFQTLESQKHDVTTTGPDSMDIQHT